MRATSAFRTVPTARPLKLEATQVLRVAAPQHPHIRHQHELDDAHGDDADRDHWPHSTLIVVTGAHRHTLRRQNRLRVPVHTLAAKLSTTMSTAAVRCATHAKPIRLGVRGTDGL